MNDITALMATMKAAAEKATPGIWEMEQENIWFFQDGYTKHLMYVTQGDDVDDQQDHINTQYIAEVSPANVLALVEALEKAQQHEQQWKSLCEAAAVDLDDWREIDDKSRGLICKLADAVIAKSERISSLESRTVTVTLPKRSVGEVMHMSGFSRDYAEGWCSGNDNAINVMKLAGIQVIEGEA